MTTKRRKPVYRVEETQHNTVRVYALRGDIYRIVAEYFDDGTYVYRYGRYGKPSQVLKYGDTLMVGRDGLLATIRRQMRERFEFHIRGRLELPWTVEEVETMK